MLAGEPPFTGPTAQAIIAKRLAGEAPRCASRARRSLSFWTRRSARRWRSSRPTASAPRPISPEQWYSAPRPPRHRQAAPREPPAGSPGGPGLPARLPPCPRRALSRGGHTAARPVRAAGSGQATRGAALRECGRHRRPRLRGRHERGDRDPAGPGARAESGGAEQRAAVSRVRPAGARVRPVTGGGLRARRHRADRRRSSDGGGCGSGRS